MFPRLYWSKRAARIAIVADQIANEWPPFDEPALLRLGLAFQRHTDHHLRRPPGRPDTAVGHAGRV